MSASVWGPAAEFHARGARLGGDPGRRATARASPERSTSRTPGRGPARSGSRPPPGRVWFKVNGAGTHHEPALLRLLADRVPGAGARGAGRRPRPGLVAVPRRRAGAAPGAPGGEVLGRLGGGGRPVRRRAARPRGAPRRSCSRPGSPRSRRARCPGSPARSSTSSPPLPVDAGGLDAGQTARLGGVLPALDDWCDELAASPVPDSLQHDDLHSGNVCWTAVGRPGPGHRLGRRHVGLPARHDAGHDELGRLPRRAVRRGAAGRPPGGAAGPGRLPRAVHRPTPTATELVRLRRPRASYRMRREGAVLPARRCGTRPSRRTPRSASRCATWLLGLLDPASGRGAARLAGGGR